MRTEAKIGLAGVVVVLLVVVAFSTFSSKNKRVAAKNSGVVPVARDGEQAPVTPAAGSTEPPVTIGAPLTGGTTGGTTVSPPPAVQPQPPVISPPIVTPKPPTPGTDSGFAHGGGDTLIGSDSGFTRGTPDDARRERIGGAGPAVADGASIAGGHAQPPAPGGHHVDGRAADGRPAGHPAVSLAGAHDYTIRANQTLSSIAAEVYGNAKYWTVIADANKDVNPNRLRVGTTIKVPDTDNVKLASAVEPSAVTSPEPALSERSYRVQSGDSLYRISKRLYGTSRRAEEIYELNRKAIGPDEARLKLGMVLQLPEPATAARVATIH